MKTTLVERYGLPPAEIEIQSFHTVDRLVSAHLIPTDPAEGAVVRRLIHAAGDPDIAGSVRLSAGAVAAGVAALQQGCPIFTDVHMISVGISTAMAARHGNRVACLMDHPEAPARAKADGTTRSIAAVRLHAAALHGAVVAIGNAPTALLALLDLVDAGVCRPALIVGTPVGFINAAESKDELMQRDVPYVTIQGYRGGSAAAVAAVNALLKAATGQLAPGAHILDR